MCRAYLASRLRGQMHCASTLGVRLATEDSDCQANAGLSSNSANPNRLKGSNALGLDSGESILLRGLLLRQHLLRGHGL
jgi:hypothetical protein